MPLFAVGSPLKQAKSTRSTDSFVYVPKFTGRRLNWVFATSHARIHARKRLLSFSQRECFDHDVSSNNGLVHSIHFVSFAIMHEFFRKSLDSKSRRDKRTRHNRRGSFSRSASFRPRRIAAELFRSEVWIRGSCNSASRTALGMHLSPKIFKLTRFTCIFEYIVRKK